ncbi:2-oxoglutarate (2OG) and Fe(II)-dependent oxygenase superfamily protein [Tanacetum coccineum]|uniref:2-oxoglutarate (2OG) and Fe(II)-dependent oxygenase superfamily protein n=1 Tax=Tanacetum coccineum TaxID=301880 RepID=A0ABQ5HEH7_9ASTR
MITLLATDGIPGLRQVCREKHKHPRTWENVNYVKWAFVVNLGDMMERWTNCILRVLPPHRSPFVDTEAEGYVPEYVDTIQRIQAAAIYIPLEFRQIAYYRPGFTDSLFPSQIRRKPPIPTDFRQKLPNAKDCQGGFWWDKVCKGVGRHRGEERGIVSCLVVRTGHNLEDVQCSRLI